ncbi:sodium:proton antiporter [Kiloniella litopenaei]|uniref:Sodium:proton antiporter n=1 Tax=Kiloniella litopenaei TaxID=1549748 RepID=A0A0M2RE69_9PROT|nr:sodium:proton antiporter [Kiloniella litopenaei]KKJ78305.1 sodium:proton antiporter [Kiloniella litopenaei]
MPTLSLFNIAAITITLAASFGYINHRWLRMPISIGLVIIALIASFIVMLVDVILPDLGIQNAVRLSLAQIDFHETLMKGMLSFLLFAGALHVDIEDLLHRKYAITLMATFGVLISTFLIGFAMFYLTGLIGLDIPLIYCLIFGSLIAPTDPVAVLGILKTVKVPRSLKAKIAGESLFNDGVGVVVFTILVAIATQSPSDDAIGTYEITRLFLLEAGGGAVLGLATGYIAYLALKSIDEYTIEVLITLALVMMSYSLAYALHFSGPIAVVIAGLLIGNRGMRFAMSESTRDHVNKFWTLLDEIMNAALFLIIGFEILAITETATNLAATLLMIPVVLIARFIAVGLPISLLSLKAKYTPGAVAVLTWGGLRGGISVALVLSLPNIPEKESLLAITYGVVIFSIIVQGLTVKKVVEHFVK